MIPEKFKVRMQEMLGEEYEPFITALTEGDAVRGMRINHQKCDTGSAVLENLPESTPLDYYPDGYILRSDEPIGTHPAHHAGLIYMQDPGAMASLAALDIPTGARVLDACAAPGGKSSQAADMIGDGGFLLSNEFVPKRAKILVSNLERLGIKNAFVTSLDTRALGDLYEEYFDVVIADVPCSGEGMFRKSEEARCEWSEENVSLCAVRQAEILENIYNTVKPGGYILYSTCTWSPEECEEIIYGFLSRHSDFDICPVKEALSRVTSDGLPIHGMEKLRLARRFYPHKAEGEGQFIALLKRDDTSPPREKINYRCEPLSPKKDILRICEDFLSDVLVKMPDARIAQQGENIVLIPHACPHPPKNSVFMCGVLLGEIRGKLLIPSHQFFSAYGRDFKRKFEISESESLIKKYLGGEELPAPDAKPGYTAITYHGATIGGGKASGGVIKNHYPKGLRNKG